MADVNYYSVVESTHDVQNPASKEKLRLVADYLEVSPGDRVLDVGSGRGWWNVELAARGADVTGLEINEDFAAAAVLRAEQAGAAVRTVIGPAAEFEAQAGAYDVVTCIGASFALDGYRPALGWMCDAVRDGGRIAIGEVHLDDGEPDEEVPSLVELVHIAEEHGVEVTGLVSASVDDWDRYESGHWASAHRWARDNPDHAQRQEILAQARANQSAYLTRTRGLLGWSILVGVVGGPNR
ncbi:class I SAM-dependent methyltransferase [Saccharopolyspora erythraea]|uniref:SAM-dependent methyltransferase n=1 Tax=Saccharopolyspora erythraea TaxID=1836 RepID=UPI001BA803E1|nr:class I SAM-dependent methyltransferase [Saccharopolyspora erythraea]QUH02757.1 class I SAM-dependent methyltransferase [Saccharopolyspora erythraea]